MFERMRAKIVFVIVLLFCVSDLFAGWTRTYGGIDTDYSYSIQQISNGGYITTEYTCSFGAGYSDVYLIKTDANGLTVEEVIISTPDNFSYRINQISNNNINIEFSLPQTSNVVLNIYDAAGRYILTPLSGNYSAGEHNVNFKMENSGVYFFNLITNESIENSKFIVF